MRAAGGRAGWAYLNSDFTTSVGYSGKPIRIVVGIDLEGRVRGLKLVEHHEPIVLIGIPEPKNLHNALGILKRKIGHLQEGTKRGLYALSTDGAAYIEGRFRSR